MLMRAVDYLLQVVFSLGIKPNAKQSETKKFSKIYYLHVKNGHSEHISFRAGGHGPFAPPPQSASVFAVHIDLS